MTCFLFVLSVLSALSVLAVPLPIAAQQSLAVNFQTAKFSWTWAPVAGSGLPTEFRVKCGAASATYTVVKTLPGDTVREAFVKDVISGLGNWFCVVTAANQYGESPPSNEVAFSAGDAPVGTIILKVTGG